MYNRKSATVARRKAEAELQREVIASSIENPDYPEAADDRLGKTPGTGLLADVLTKALRTLPEADNAEEEATLP